MPNTVRLHRVLRAASDMQDAGVGWDKGCVMFYLPECPGNSPTNDEFEIR